MKKGKKYLILGTAALVLVGILATPGCNRTRRTGWVEDEGQYYYYDNRGHMVTGWFAGNDGTYYLKEDGARATGWLEIGGARYYFMEDGVMMTGGIAADGTDRFFLGPDGTALTGLASFAGHHYYLGEDGRMVTGWVELDGSRYYFDPAEGWALTGLATLDGTVYAFREDGTLASGWFEWDGKNYYITPEGTPGTGWQEIDGVTYYLDDDGSLYGGWLEDGGHTYYMKDGVFTTGILKLDGQTHFFDSRGWSIQMVNPWNPLPEGTGEVQTASVGGDHYIAVEAKADFSAMVYAMQQAGLGPIITSSYRTGAKQQSIFDERMAGYMAQGMTEEEAYAETATSVAIPGTSEHQLGLAMDMTDAHYSKLDEGQMETPTQLWLIENSWRYGFILRYPNGKSHITGIIYEPWHYRYVGRELAAELYELGLTMEEYLDMLTEDKSLTASNPENGNTMS